eukprot:CAMPEP_0172511168 /NCGR_PEP_ID=MMETSP1066-20121228/234376_1 /TAXON_ID=671091 /ORGANISM="Coscinodiscus wailesii, Strain CCMP2513" /LENGTH=96 /DNA_ID=CAMNT_0013290441 /DNA_START=564 /DNA_END=854 /DNA_ORIENTATION=+
MSLKYSNFSTASIQYYKRDLYSLNQPIALTSSSPSLKFIIIPGRLRQIPFLYHQFNVSSTPTDAKALGYLSMSSFLHALLCSADTDVDDDDDAHSV